MEEGSRIESSTAENKDIMPNVHYIPINDDEFRNKQVEKEDNTPIHVITDEKSKQTLIQKEQNKYGSEGKINDRIENYISIINNVLRNNDSKILTLLSQEPSSNYSFKGLVRKLNLHQQSLVRALNILEDLRLIEKSQIGYRLTKYGESQMALFSSKRKGTSNLVSNNSAPRQEKGKKERRDGYIQLLQTYIPVNVKPEEILHKLIGKWFDNLRWVGLIESGARGYMLQWITDNSNAFQIILRMISDYFIIETNAYSDKEKI